MKLSSLSLALSALLAGRCSAFAPRASLSSSSSSSSLHSPSRRSSSSPGGAPVPVRLFGILDEINSDAFDLSGSGKKKGVPMSLDLDDAAAGAKAEDGYEVLLADIVFSTNDPRMDIIENYDRTCDPAFVGWLKDKFERSRDAEEKAALRDLYDMIQDVKKKVELSAAAEERKKREAEGAEAARVREAEAAAAEGRKLTDADVLMRAAAVDTAGVAEAKAAAEEARAAAKKRSFYDEELTPEIRASYEDTVKKVLPPYKAGESPASIAFTYYDQFDAQFVKVLAERKENGDEDAAAVLDALAVEQSKRLSAATETLKGVLALGDPARMEGAIVKLAREGRVDEPFLLLLEANANQADAAGARGPAELMRRLRDRAADEKDKQGATKEVVLLRKLLRTDDPQKREQLLEEAFTPKEQLIVPGTMENARRAVDGEAPEEQKPMPDVPPPDFINACKAVTLNFGNLSYDDDRGDLATKIKKIAAEAEVVATRIYGKGMTAREQQDRAWNERTASIFDLEQYEIEAERMGSKAPWTTDEDGDILPGFDGDGRMQVGGS